MFLSRFLMDAYETFFVQCVRVRRHEMDRSEWMYGINWVLDPRYLVEVMICVLFVSPNKDKLRYVLRILFPASNNMAEYEVCLHGIRLAVELGVKRLYVHGDSALVINQLNKE